jgi:transposase
MRDGVDGFGRGGHGEVRMGRKFTPEYKQKILTELDAALAPGERGAILRRENLYWSTVSRWRERRDAAVREGLKESKRGPKVDQLAREVRRLRERNERLEERLRTAEELAVAQGNAFALLQA